MIGNILYEFDFPIIVICCFGTQSIGKSTFLNELAGSMFNISGMRCTEGICFSLKTFKNSDEQNKTTELFCDKVMNVVIINVINILIIIMNAYTRIAFAKKIAN